MKHQHKERGKAIPLHLSVNRFDGEQGGLRDFGVLTANRDNAAKVFSSAKSTPNPFRADSRAENAASDEGVSGLADRQDNGSDSGLRDLGDGIAGSTGVRVVSRYSGPISVWMP
ncbi:hypothetical protein PI124_g587 [Phytophthora idaei]|nr:hypothetical protein PI126_g2853 [Phytophthora idaei]KAG3254806.1 hypothetical protein PI124_g587 [Phytophthora idaei]